MEVDKKIILVTGASKGFGQSIAIHWAKSCSQGSKIILTARSENGLRETESEIKSLNKGIDVVKFITDHGNPVKEEYEALFEREIKSPGETYDFGLIVHNVGVVEPQGDHVIEYSNLEEMEKYFRLNLYSLMMLNSVFFQVKKYLSKPLRIINISSVAAIDPIATWGYYCMGKAARWMYFRILAIEEKDIRVLNYSPGVMNTSAVERITESNKTTEDISKFCKENVIEPSVSAKKLALIIEKDEYVSGAQIDFEDEI